MDPAEQSPGVNRVVLSGVAKERSALRYTPAGMPALDLVIDHQSLVHEESLPRSVKMQCRAVAIGTRAGEVQQLGMDEPAVFDGFLAPARAGRSTVFHITRIRRLESAQEPQSQSK